MILEFLYKGRIRITVSVLTSKILVVRRVRVLREITTLVNCNIVLAELADLA